jgi:hypothetical protein
VTDLRAELERTRRFVRRTGLSSLMSNTKWRKVLAAVTQADEAPAKLRVKMLEIDSPCLLTTTAIGLHPPLRYIDTLEFGPIALLAIEWLEVPSALLDQLEDVGELAVETYGANARIMGHK